LLAARSQELAVDFHYPFTKLPNYPVLPAPRSSQDLKDLAETSQARLWSAAAPGCGGPGFRKEQQLSSWSANYSITKLPTYPIHSPNGPRLCYSNDQISRSQITRWGAPRSSQDLKDLPETSQARLMERSPGSPERAGFACSGVEAPSAAGFLGSARSQKLVAGLQITQLPNYPFTQWGSSQDLKDLAETSQAVPRPPSLFDLSLCVPLCPLWLTGFAFCNEPIANAGFWSAANLAHSSQPCNQSKVFGWK
jgi:hypothetical protein